MLNITLKDGAVREVAEGTSIADFVKSVSNSLAKKVLAAKLDGKTVDLATPLTKDAKVEFLTFEDADGRWALRHTGSHILAQALKRLYKNENVKLAIGPAIDNGFYYDIDMDRQLSESDLTDIEKEMRKIVKENLPLVRKDGPVRFSPVGPVAFPVPADGKAIDETMALLTQVHDINGTLRQRPQLPDDFRKLFFGKLG